MRYLFIHQSFPAQYAHILKHLVKQGGNEIVFITSQLQPEIEGVRKVLYAIPPVQKGGHPCAKEFSQALWRADIVATVAGSVKALGYIPDIIIGHHGWGELLRIVDIFPDTPLLGYFEFYYSLTGQDVDFDPEFPFNSDLAPYVRGKNAVNLQALTLPGWGQTPTLFQKETYPEWAQQKINLLREGVDLDICRPDRKCKKADLKIGELVLSAKEKIVTYAARSLEPYRGFHSFMRALPSLLKERSDVRVVVVGRDTVSYGMPPKEGGSWRQKLLSELEGKLDLTRINFIDWLSHKDLIKLLQRSDVHAYLTYPFVLSWSLREAMAVGCPLVVSDTAPIREFLSDGKNARFAPFLESGKIADSILELLENPAQAQRLGNRARTEARAVLDVRKYLQSYDDLIARLVG